MPRFYIAVALLGFCFGCNNSGPPRTTGPIKNADWLLGTWKNTFSEGVMIESWKKENDHLFSGYSYVLRGHDTLSLEFLKIEQKDNELLYVATVKEQNAGKPVEFRLTASAEDELIFENPKHDFPQKLSYLKIGNDSLVAMISGTIKGHRDSMVFRMRRSSQN
jgi:hypothetical protein